jgi:hypothetical protein
VLRWFTANPFNGIYTWRNYVFMWQSDSTWSSFWNTLLVSGIGAALGSLTFFSALGFGARLLAPIFASPRAWVVLELVIGATMWAIAAGLAFGG